jgi:hypothetical protein
MQISEAASNVSNSEPMIRFVPEEESLKGRTAIFLILLWLDGNFSALFFQNHPRSGFLPAFVCAVLRDKEFVGDRREIIARQRNS